MREARIIRPHPVDHKGVQKLYRFANDYGASVVRFRHSYGFADGLWELAVIHYTDHGDDDYSLAYDTPITDDVLGCLNDEEVDEILDQVALLPAKVNA